jgi:hypothetical protein
MQRIFIVGCPRSGTTIVQAMLARHPQVLTLPETALFERLYGELAARWGDHGVSSRPRRAMQLGFARQGGRHALASLQRKLGTGGGPAPLRMAACVERFVQMLDGLAVEAGRDSWIEKTPNHLLYISEIEQYVPDARFVHVVRPGLDVLASIADANLHYDDNHGFGGDAKLWANRWNRAVAIHRRHIGRPNHHVVFLDDFVRDTAGEWRRLCEALALDPQAPLDQACGQPVADLADEPWKRQAVHGRLRPPRSKAQALFGPELLAWLSQRLVALEPLREQCRLDNDTAITADGHLDV